MASFSRMQEIDTRLNAIDEERIALMRERESVLGTNDKWLEDVAGFVTKEIRMSPTGASDDPDCVHSEPFLNIDIDPQMFFYLNALAFKPVMPVELAEKLMEIILQIKQDDRMNIKIVNVGLRNRPFGRQLSFNEWAAPLIDKVRASQISYTFSKEELRMFQGVR